MRTLLRTCVIIMTFFTILTGLIYPITVTALAQVMFPYQANGSLIMGVEDILGSELIGQYFNEARYFWARPSTTVPVPYNAAASSGSNLAPASPTQVERVQGRIGALIAVGPGNVSPIPVDLVTASSSGLDPHISVAAALYQVARVARERNLDEEQVRLLVQRFTEGRQLGFLGEPRVNVLRLNLALEGLQ